ncbi:hypothetical protein F0562_000949 [Nyssa sinensis]|uniref:DUF4378 domain-containing protein n=1 Tax=Nyssa sinensis TaxID=561372 RepID=A0A5J5C1H6_9ASTE|nr:hypothetical protein F0562_000949 [Nyssa sinensis]
MAKNLWSKNSDHEFEDNYHPGCMWGILHALDYHHWHTNVKKMPPHKKQNGRRHGKRNGSSKTQLNVHDSGEVKRLLDAEASQFHVDQSSTKTSSTNKWSLRARIKALTAEEMSKEEDHNQWGSGVRSGLQLRRTYSIHHLEPDYNLGEIATKWKHPNKADNSATRLQDQAQMKANEEPVACNENFGVDHRKNAVYYLEHNQLAENRTLCPEKCDKTKETLVNQKLVEAKQFSGNVSHYPFKEYEDILEIFKVNKELFLKILQNADDGIENCFHSLQASNMQARLTKSGSFPVAGLSCSRNLRPSKLKHKQNEIWSFPKGDKLLAGTQAPKLIASMFPKDLHSKSGPLMANDSGGKVLNHEKSFSSLASTQALDKSSSSEAVIDLLKEIKQRMEHAIEEGENESNLTSLDTLLGPSTGGKEMAERWKDSTTGRDNKDSSSSSHEIDGFVLSKDTLTRIRRTSSLNESLDRYAQLFDYSFSREAKLPRSKSLKLTNEYEIPSGRHGTISFRRIRSLTHLDSCCPLQNEVSRDAHLAGMSLPIMSIVDRGTNIESDSHDEPKPISLPVSTDKYVSLNANEGIECLNNMVERTDGSTRMENLTNLTVGINDEETAKMDGLSEEMDELTVGESSSHKEQEITGLGLPQPSSVVVQQSCFQEDATTPAEFPISEGLECRHNGFDEKDSSVNSKPCSEAESLSWTCSTLKPENYENASKSVKNQRHVELYTKDDDDFNYVREILERSGFIRNSFLGTWHLPDQPVNPSVFEEVEVCWPHELECSVEDIWGCCHHQLLFDLVNEVLLQIYDKSFTYYPKSLSFSCHIRPVPVGYRVLEEVWSSISGCLSFRQELEHPLDCVVAQDMAKDDGWMSLQLETECVALELEDLIFDELLEELICS